MQTHLDLSLFKKSSIGTTVEADIDEVEIDYDYTGVAWFFITFFGTTQHPKKIVFTCKSTQEKFETLTDKKLIKHFLFYRKK